MTAGELFILAGFALTVVGIAVHYGQKYLASRSPRMSIEDWVKLDASLYGVSFFRVHDGHLERIDPSTVTIKVSPDGESIAGYIVDETNSWVDPAVREAMKVDDDWDPRAFTNY